MYEPVLCIVNLYCVLLLMCSLVLNVYTYMYAHPDSSVMTLGSYNQYIVFFTYCTNHVFHFPYTLSTSIEAGALMQFHMLTTSGFRKMQKTHFSSTDYINLLYMCVYNWTHTCSPLTHNTGQIAITAITVLHTLSLQSLTRTLPRRMGATSMHQKYW